MIFIFFIRSLVKTQKVVVLTSNVRIRNLSLVETARLGCQCHVVWPLFLKNVSLKCWWLLQSHVSSPTVFETYYKWHHSKVMVVKIFKICSLANTLKFLKEKDNHSPSHKLKNNHENTFQCPVVVGSMQLHNQTKTHFHGKKPRRHSFALPKT